MPALGGLEAAREIVRFEPKTRVLIVSTHAHPSVAIEALRTEASGYVLRAKRLKFFRLCGRSRAGGSICPRPGQAGGKFHPGGNLNPSDPYEKLRQVLHLAAEGFGKPRDRRSPAHQSPNRGKLMQKLALPNHTELVLYAMRRGLIPSISLGDPSPRPVVNKL